MQEEKNIQPSLIQEEEITLKQLVSKLSEYSREVRKNWLILILFCLLPTSYFMYKAFFDRPLYLTKLTFMINSDESKSGGVASILGQFGLGEGESKDNLDKILALSKSNIILERVLCKKGSIDGVTDYYANHMIRLYKFHEKWEKDTTGLKNFLYKSGDSLKFIRKESLMGYLYNNDNAMTFSRTESGVLKTLTTKLIGSELETGIFSSIADKKSGIMTLSLNTVSEDLSIKLLEEIYLQLSKFYIDKTTEKQRRSYELVAAKVDSIESALTGVEYRQADFDDHNRMILFEKAKLPKLRLNRDRTILNLMYNEAIKNQELAEFALKNKIPYVQLIDTPIPPIKPIKQSKLRALIYGIGLGVFIGIVFITIRKMIREALA
jgi:G-rich domain on putative tyrosine kinase